MPSKGLSWWTREKSRRSIQGNHVTFTEITMAPWYDISKDSQDHLVACTLDYCAKETDDMLQVDRTLAEKLKEFQGVVVDQIPDPFDRLSRTDKESKATYKLLQGEVVHLPNELYWWLKAATRCWRYWKSPKKA